MLKMEKLAVSQLRLGMYVAELDRPWLGTPFLLQGFEITTENEIRQLRELCQFVYIDIRLSSEAHGGTSPSGVRKTPSRDKRLDLLKGRKLTFYRDEETVEDELPAAQEAVQALSDSVHDIFKGQRAGEAINVAEVKAAVEPMVESIRRNPDACIWLSRLRQQDNYTYQHSVACSIWAVAVGRQLSMPEEDLRSLAVGGLLLDVGKLEIESELLSKTDALTSDEWARLRSHVELGESTLEGQSLNRDVMDMVRYHHERFDGSGYPNGLAGEDIPVFGRIAAVVDTFDAMTSHRTYAEAISPSAAIQKLNVGRDKAFQAEIVDEFIQAIGVYAAGTLVLLSSGEVAVVISEGRVRRLRPKVMVLLKPDKTPLATPYMIDLRENLQDESGEPLGVVTSLPINSYGIDIAGLKL